jgi:hypothetical protein
MTDKRLFRASCYAQLQQSARLERERERERERDAPKRSHDDQHGTTDAKCSPVLRPVRAGGHRRADPGQDRRLRSIASPATYRMITRLPNCLRREPGVQGLGLLEADDVRLGFAKPAQQVRQAPFDVVDVESGDLHRFRQRSERIDLALGLRFGRSPSQSLTLKGKLANGPKSETRS